MWVRNWILRVVIVGFVAVAAAKRPIRFASPAPAGVASVRVMTYNVHFDQPGDADTLAVLERLDPDLVCFQETNDPWVIALTQQLGRRWPHQAFRVDDPYGAGIGVMSKWPIVEVQYLPKVSWFPAQRVVVQSPIGRLQLLNVHLRPPSSESHNLLIGAFTTPSIRRREIEAFAAALDPALPTLIVGDFNENEYGRAMRWLGDRGYRSALPEFSPYAKTWRFPATTSWGLRERFDHLCYDAALTALEAHVDPAGRSDHLAVWGVFTRNETNESE